MNMPLTIRGLLMGKTALVFSLILHLTASADTIRYADSDPTDCLRCRMLVESYFPALAEATDSRVEVNGLFGAVLGSNKENLKLASEGVVQFSSTFVGYHNNIFPAQSAFDLFPTGPKKFENQLYFYRQAYSRIPEIQQELEQNNLKLVMISPLLHLAFASKSPIVSLDDVQGQKWRAGTKWLLRYLENIGASPVSIPWGDVYVSLETGVIEGVLTNYDAMNNAKFYEPAPHILISPELWMANPMIYLVNKDYWDSLPQDIQDSWLQASRDAEVEWGRRLNAARDEIIQSQKAKGITVSTMSSQDLNQWKSPDTIENARADWVKEARKAGLSNAAGVLDELKKIHAEALARD